MSSAGILSQVSHAMSQIQSPSDISLRSCCSCVSFTKKKHATHSPEYGASSRQELPKQSQHPASSTHRSRSSGPTTSHPHRTTASAKTTQTSKIKPPSNVSAKTKPREDVKTETDEAKKNAMPVPVEIRSSRTTYRKTLIPADLIDGGMVKTVKTKTGGVPVVVLPLLDSEKNAVVVAADGVEDVKKVLHCGKTADEVMIDANNHLNELLAPSGSNGAAPKTPTALVLKTPVLTQKTPVATITIPTSTTSNSKKKNRIPTSVPAKTNKESCSPLQGLWLDQHTKQAKRATGKEVIISDIGSGAIYIKGRLLGKGGFARCHKLTERKMSTVFAGKIISQNRLIRRRDREKMLREVELHRTLHHDNIVAFHSFFEDSENVYIVLEYCSRQSLDQVIKCRKMLTEPEVRYYMRQLIEGCYYVHQQHIIHRDLKLANMLLNSQMQLKIADFGLATKVTYSGEKKMTVCGTPNYIAPEVLQHKGHSYEADVWAMGCIMFAMLCGRPPFETSSLKETYSRITSGTYNMPLVISASASELIRQFLNLNPSHRPLLEKILLSSEFFTNGFTPLTLSPTCCTVLPRFTSASVTEVKTPMSLQPLQRSDLPRAFTPAVIIPNMKEVVRKKTAETLPPPPLPPPPPPAAPAELDRSVSQIEIDECSRSVEDLSSRGPSLNVPIDNLSLSSHASSSANVDNCDMVESVLLLHDNLVDCIEKIPRDSAKCTPVSDYTPLSVTKWVDYSNKYGFGFELSDGTIGIIFNDDTRMILLGLATVLAIDANNIEVGRFEAKDAPADMKKKSSLLVYFAEYMEHNLVRGADVTSSTIDTPLRNDSAEHADTKSKSSIPYVRKWFRSSKAMVMCLSVGSVQVNFFNDHTKLILSTSMPKKSQPAVVDPATREYYVTYISENRQVTSYNLARLCKSGCPSELVTRLKYARKMLLRIIVAPD